jgi:hypothetical protein
MAKKAEKTGKVRAMLDAAKAKKKHKGSGGSKGPRDVADADAEVEGREEKEKAHSEETKGKRIDARLGDTPQKAIQGHMAAAGRRTQGRRDSKGR